VKNVEIARTAMEAFNRGDREAWLAAHDPDAGFRADPEWPESESVEGREAVWDFLVDLTDVWEQDPVELIEVIEISDDKLAARFRRPTRGKASGIADVLDYWSVITFSEGRILRYEWFATRAKVLEATGLPGGTEGAPGQASA
jgi:ketosteroid isomerase-like protein